MRPRPDFTIEDLLKEAITERHEDEANVFTSKELGALWGFKDAKTVYKHMDKLGEKGWQFVPTRKDIIDRAGRTISTNAYKIIPPYNEETPV